RFFVKKLRKKLQPDKENQRQKPLLKKKTSKMSSFIFEVFFLQRGRAAPQYLVLQPFACKLYAYQFFESFWGRRQKKRLSIVFSTT
ncbi:MAG: hypothetical protein IJA52_06765, partial [Clostridia bacterium]|nr:hypothetical protein [Clostridia bacterium]